MKQNIISLGFSYVHFPLSYVVWKVLQKAEFVAIIDS